MNTNLNDAPTLRGKVVLLSASCPAPNQADEFEPPDPVEVDAAVSAITHSILAVGGRIAFGGHPTISSLIQLASEDMLPPDLATRRQLSDDRVHPVIMYLSKAFEGQLDEGLTSMMEGAWAETRWVDAEGRERAKIHPRKGLNTKSVRQSLLRLRKEMMMDSALVAAIFVGGKQGIIDELELYQSISEDGSRAAITYAFSYPGGAAQIISQRANVGFSPPAEDALSRLGDCYRGSDYDVLATWIVRDISARISSEG